LPKILKGKILCRFATLFLWGIAPSLRSALGKDGVEDAGVWGKRIPHRPFFYLLFFFLILTYFWFFGGRGGKVTNEATSIISKI